MNIHAWKKALIPVATAAMAVYSIATHRAGWITGCWIIAGVLSLASSLMGFMDEDE